MDDSDVVLCNVVESVVTDWFKCFYWNTDLKLEYGSSVPGAHNYILPDPIVSCKLKDYLLIAAQSALAMPFVVRGSTKGAGQHLHPLC